MRTAGVTASIALLAAGPVLAGDGAPDPAAIRTLLTQHKVWAMYIEYTDAPVPGERAQKLRFEYFERDGKLMGRWILEFGGCEFEVSISAQSFSFPWCPPYRGVPVLVHDAADADYPFKSRDPRKLWLKPER